VSFISKAISHVCSEAERNGVKVPGDLRAELRDQMKARLYKLEREIFGILVESSGVDNDRVLCYRAGAFDLHAFAPGGILEVDVDGHPVPWERIRCPVCVEDGTKHSKSMCEAKYRSRHRG